MVRNNKHKISVEILGSDDEPLQEYRDAYFDAFNDDDDRRDAPLWERAFRDATPAIFANPDGQDPGDVGQWPRTVRVCRYIEARKGQRWKLRCNWEPGFPFKEDKTHSVYVQVFVDGQKVEAFQPNNGMLNRRGGYNAVMEEARTRKGDVPFSFGENAFTYENDEADDPAGAREKSMGTIQVYMWRIIAHGKKSKPHTASRNLQSASSKAMREGRCKKADFPAYGTNYGPPKAGKKQYACPKTFLDGGPQSRRKNRLKPSKTSLGHPFAEFKFKYRSRMFLQSKDLIGMSPAPYETNEDRRRIKWELNAAVTNAGQVAARREQQLGQRLTEEPAEDSSSEDEVILVRATRDEDRRGNRNASPIDLTEELPGDVVDQPIVLSDEDDDTVIQSIERHQSAFERVNSHLRRAGHGRNPSPERSSSNTPQRGEAIHVRNNGQAEIASDSQDDELFHSQNTEPEMRREVVPAELQQQVLDRGMRAEAVRSAADDDERAAVRRRMEARRLQPRSTRPGNTPATSSSRRPPSSPDRIPMDANSSRFVQRRNQDARPPRTHLSLSSTPHSPQTFGEANQQGEGENAKKRKRTDLTETDGDIFDLIDSDEE